MALAYRDEEESEDPSDSAFAEAMQAWFPDEVFDEERLAGAKEAIRLCVEKDEAGEYGGEGKSKKGGLDMLIALGPKSKK